MFGQAQDRLLHAKPRQDIIVMRHQIIDGHANSDGQIRLERRIKANLPPEGTRDGLHATNDNNGGREFSIDPQKVGNWILDDASSDRANTFHDSIATPEVEPPQPK